jgi:hypothetical protein
MRLVEAAMLNPAQKTAVSEALFHDRIELPD